MANLWLVKSEPDTYAYADLVKDGETVWDGVRNNAAALHLKAMAVGDEVLFYHSGADKAVVGVAKVSKAAFPDPSDEGGRFVAVELTPVRALAKPVTLAQIKGDSALAHMVMVRQGRLSVSPVTADEWSAILKLGA